MGVPDYWIKIIKEKKDEEWNLGELFHTLLNRRFRRENTLVTAESTTSTGRRQDDRVSTDGASTMYWQMSREAESLVRSDSPRRRAAQDDPADHVQPRSGEGLTELHGQRVRHPEWIDFPREGNNWCTNSARRQWSLADNPRSALRGVLAFDRAMKRARREVSRLADPLIRAVARARA
jgi:1,4-alpha-glucan branching enzyme